MVVGVLFPGQGSQTVGMGADLFEARSDLLGERADQILGFSLRSMCLDGPEQELTRTEHAQPALFSLCYALWDLVEEAGGLHPEGAAGHSLGEYTALAAAGVFDFETGLRLVSSRGRAMAGAAALEDSGMAAVLGAERETVEAVCRDLAGLGRRLVVANVNAPGQVVVAGGRDDLDWLAANARDHGLRRVVPLKVAGAFHSEFMAPAQAEVGEALKGVGWAEPRFPVWSNTTARPHETVDPGPMLTRQLVEPVLFADSLGDMSGAGIDTFVHIGPGDVTAGLARRTLPDAATHVISTVDDIRPVLEAIGTMPAHRGEDHA